MLVVPATQESEAKGSFKPRNWRPTWATKGNTVSKIISTLHSIPPYML